jgi:signal transduction histidine kinase
MSATAPTQRHRAVRPDRRALLDAALAVAAFAATLVLLRHGGVFPARGGWRELDPLGVLLAAWSTLPVVAWRLAPLGVFAITGTGGVLLVGLGYPADLMLGPAAALYLLAASRSRETPWPGHITATVLGALLAYLGAAAAAQQALPWTELLHTGLAWSGAWLAGERTRLRRERVADLHERAVRAEQGAERERLLAVAEERARIARDLHDSAGHAISVIAVRAGAARLRHHQEPDRSLAALAAIEELARQTVAEIDLMVGTLREGGPQDEVVPPGLASLNSLVTNHAAAGLDVTVRTEGTSRPLGAAGDQAAYRILQEALTNAAHHGAGSARIDLAYGAAAVELVVTNPVHGTGDGARPGVPAARPGGGHGLTGMRERAVLAGGSLDATRVDRGFRVRATIPYGDGRP